MLLELNIENFAIIKDLELNFERGLNIISGETGTGKSILIEALAAILGSRVNRDYIRTGKDNSKLSAIFYLENDSEVLNLLNDYNITIDEDKVLIIEKEIYTDRPNRSKINGKTVNLTMLKDITDKLIDIYGQHEHQTLLDESNHIKIIDSFGNEEFFKLKENIKENYNKYSKIKNQLNSINIDHREKDREIDILEFQIREIEDVNIDIEKDESLKDNFKEIESAEIIKSSLYKIKELLNSDDMMNISVLNILNEIRTDLETVSDNGEYIKEYLERINTVIFELEDLSREIQFKAEHLNFDEEELLNLKTRIDSINTLKMKYGNTLEDILKFKDENYEKLNRLKNQDKEIEFLNKEIKKLEDILYKDSIKLRQYRKDISLKIEGDLAKELNELKMEDVVLKVDFKDKSISDNGIDLIEFLISTNKGQDLKPLSKISSGGEMSRIMLAIKSIIAVEDDIEAFVFDEIDAGISGRTAQLVGEKIYKISKDKQIICISHLPQITAMADQHFLIDKYTDDDETISSVRKLNKEEQIDEIARIIGGANITDTTLKHAEEIIQMAEEIKSANER